MLPTQISHLLKAATDARLRRAREQGAVLVETAIVFLVVVMMAFGVIEYGLMLRQLDDMADSVRAGTRAASAGSNATTADWEIISAMKDSNTSLGGNITHLVIFKADANGNPTGTCANFTAQPGQCNVYTASDFSQSKAFIDNKAATQGGWRPVDREASVDYIGVRARTNYSWITKFFGSTPRVLSDSAVALIEPAGTVPASGSPGAGGEWTSGDNPTPPRGSQVPAASCPGCGGGGGGGGVING